MARKQPTTGKPVIGWREWVALPDLGLEAVKAKIDTGARTSSLHAWNPVFTERGDDTWVRFEVHPIQRSKASTTCQAKVLEFRNVRSSNGQTQRRPVIITPVSLLGEQYEIELTLANRDEMGFRLLLGREAVRGRFLVDAGKSFYAGQPKKKAKKNPGKANSGAKKKSSKKKKLKRKPKGESAE